MIPEDEQIAQLRDRLGLHIRNGVFVRQSRRGVLRLEQPLELDVIEPDEIEIVILFVENRQPYAKHFFVPSCAGDRELIIRDDQCAPLGWREVTQDDYRDFSHGELLGGQQTCVSRDYVVGGAHQDWVCKSKFAD